MRTPPVGFGAILLTVACLMAAPVVVSAQSGGDLLRLLPQGQEAGHWLRTGEPEIVTGEDLYVVIDGGAEIYHEYGFNAAVFQTYRTATGESINLEIYEMTDPGAAYGMYTFKTGTNGDPVPFGHGGWFEEYYLNFWEDEYLVTVIGLGTGGGIPAGIRNVAAAVDAKLDGESILPRVVSYLPRNDLKANGVTYIRGPIGLRNAYWFDETNIFGVEEGVIGNYDVHRLFVFEYPDEDTSSSWYEHAKIRLRQNERFSGFDDRDTGFEVYDPDSLRLSVKRMGRWVVVVLADAEMAVEPIMRSLELPRTGRD